MFEEIPKIFQYRLNQLMKKDELSWDDLTTSIASLGYPTGLVRKIKQGELPDCQMLCVICAILRTTPDFLLGYKRKR